MGKALGHWKAPPLVERGKQSEHAILIECCEFAVTRAFDDADLALEPIGIFQLLHEVGNQPADTSGKDQRRHTVRRYCLEQLPPDPKQEGMVLADFDR